METTVILVLISIIILCIVIISFLAVKINVLNKTIKQQKINFNIACEQIKNGILTDSVIDDKTFNVDNILKEISKMGINNISQDKRDFLEKNYTKNKF